uniref:TSEN34 N-terminal domain-containing protein n=1 Tax=Cacopsylla melanoneura TaxID=428564 RepID=A0A8D9E105_9HEMI
MISIHVDSQYNGFIWDADDWYELRCHHHIVGNLIGTLSSVSKNAKVLALPCQLLPEEITLLVELKICKLVKIKQETQETLSNLKEKYGSYKEEIKKEQVEAFKKGKEKKILNMIDNIVKNKEASAKNGEKIDRNQILQEELAKLGPLSAEHILVQRFLGKTKILHTSMILN